MEYFKFKFESVLICAMIFLLFITQTTIFTLLICLTTSSVATFSFSIHLGVYIRCIVRIGAVNGHTESWSDFRHNTIRRLTWEVRNPHYAVEFEVVDPLWDFKLQRFGRSGYRTRLACFKIVTRTTELSTEIFNTTDSVPAEFSSYKDEIVERIALLFERKIVILMFT